MSILRIRYLFILCLFLTPTLEAQSAENPNIVIIYADDLGYGDVSCYNPNRGKIPTPHIDKLAEQGMLFTDGHSSSGVCSPSRYTLLTGRYHWRSRLQSGIVGLWAPPLIGPERLTISKLLKQNGYQTAMVGKWHLGWHWPIAKDKLKLLRGSKTKDVAATDEQKAVWKDLFSQPIPGGPMSIGFDSYFGTDVPNWPPFCFIENDRTVGTPTEFLPARLFKNNMASQQGPAIEGWTLEPILPALGNRASKFISEAAKKEAPYFLFMPLTSPHTPLSVNDEWKGKSGLGPYADLVMETDHIVGQVMKAIDDSDTTDNTLVIFTSDNGCAHYIGTAALEEAGHFASGPLRGYKSDVWEGGHRVPFIIRWPNSVKPGSKSDQLVHQADFMATFADILEIDLPDNAGEDSFSLLPILKGIDKPVRETSVSQSIRGMSALRKGPWKIIFGKGSGGWTKGGELPVQLYNLHEDLSEKNNLAKEKPETVSDLIKLMEQLVSNGRSTPGDKQANDATVTWKKFMN